MTHLVSATQAVHPPIPTTTQRLANVIYAQALVSPAQALSLQTVFPVFLPSNSIKATVWVFVPSAITLPPLTFANLAIPTVLTAVIQPLTARFVPQELTYLP